MCWRWCLDRWRLWIRPAVGTLYGLLILVLLPLCILKFQRESTSPEVQAWFTAGLFVLMALPITFWQITQHLIHFTRPHLQRHIIRILWMVPIYALNAWLALTFPSAGIYLDTLRECYEAYVIYNFMRFLLNFLDLEALTGPPSGPVSHLPPLCCLPPCPAGRYFIQACKHGILQYTVIRPMTTAIALITEICGVYGEGKFSPSYAYPYILAVNNISQFVAMYSLALFYKANREELAPMKPIAKFLCIKAVVFFSFFQSVVIAILTYVGIITESFTAPGSDAAQVARSLQNFLICIEMFVAAAAHHFAFPYRPYIDLAARPQPCCAAFLSMWDLSDVTQDVHDHICHVGKKVKMSLSSNSIPGEGRPLLVSHRDTEPYGAVEAEQYGATIAEENALQHEGESEMVPPYSGESSSAPSMDSNRNVRS